MISTKSNSNFKISVIAPSYTRFSIIDFVTSSKMRSTLTWFADQYTDALARNPNAIFHFGGHSNGTRVLGLALNDLPGMSFTHVYLAASPLPESYDWDSRKKRGQVQAIRNDRGTMDWAVGVAARSLGRLRFKSIGAAGLLGFKDSWIIENTFEGGHGAMLHDKNNPSIVQFLMNGTSDGHEAAGHTSRLFNFLSRYGDLALIVLGILILVIVIFGLRFDPMLTILLMTVFSAVGYLILDRI
jgi:hypothetical protein